jgi:hypothetical protein
MKEKIIKFIKKHITKIIQDFPYNDKCFECNEISCKNCLFIKFKY